MISTAYEQDNKPYREASGQTLRITARRRREGLGLGTSAGGKKGNLAWIGIHSSYVQMQDKKGLSGLRSLGEEMQKLLCAP